MKKIYHSKIGLEIVIPMVLILGSVGVLIFFKDPSGIGLAVLSALLLWIAHMFTTTTYTIDQNKLMITSGFLYHKTIDIHTIKRITETNIPISSPAASLDRLEINCGKSGSVIISPKLKMAFIKDIQMLNPNIEVRLKNKKNNTLESTPS
jgi:hypothetical protein